MPPPPSVEKHAAQLRAWLADWNESYHAGDGQRAEELASEEARVFPKPAVS